MLYLKQDTFGIDSKHPSTVCLSCDMSCGGPLVFDGEDFECPFCGARVSAYLDIPNIKAFSGEDEAMGNLSVGDRVRLEVISGRTIGASLGVVRVAGFNDRGQATVYGSSLTGILYQLGERFFYRDKGMTGKDVPVVVYWEPEGVTS